MPVAVRVVPGLNHQTLVVLEDLAGAVVAELILRQALAEPQA
jgi:hypothetical protein